jgi:hypothetical protein
MERFEINDWEWEINCKADVKARIERLETETLLEVYWRGQAPERQRETAREVRDLLRTCEALKERMQTWARKKIARVV